MTNFFILLYGYFRNNNTTLYLRRLGALGGQMGTDGRPSHCNESYPVPAHQRVAAELITELTLALRRAVCKSCRVYDPLDYKIADDTVLVPEILIICGEVKKKYLDFPPSLVVEILSPLTVLRDRNTKYQYYRQQGVKYFLIVDADKKDIEVYLLQEGQYFLQEIKNSYSFYLNDDCSITPDLSNVFD